ncbi:MAG: SPOR domain-containing protein [Saprospiraceae bacterium]
MKKLILIAIFGFLTQFATAQGVININQDATLESALEKHKQINRNTGKVDGWTVMIMSSTDRTKVTNTKAAFLRTFPSIPVDWEYTRPFFKLRAGAYASKLEAASLLARIKTQYPSAYIGRAKFSPRELL